MLFVFHSWSWSAEPFLLSCTLVMLWMLSAPVHYEAKLCGKKKDFQDLVAQSRMTDSSFTNYRLTNCSRNRYQIRIWLAATRRNHMPIYFKTFYISYTTKFNNLRNIANSIFLSFSVFLFIIFITFSFHYYYYYFIL